MRLYDKFINVQIEYETDDNDNNVRKLASNKSKKTQYLNITCPKSGRKPSIQVDYSQIPGNVCYSLTCKISNLYIEGLNAIWVRSLDIQLGYYAGGQEQSTNVHCEVFAGYTPEPGPDGYTIFEGIIGSSDVDKLSSQQYLLTLMDTEDTPLTIANVIKECCSAMGLTSYLYMQSKIADQKFSQEDIDLKTVPSGYALIMWLQEQINAIGLGQKKPEDRFLCTTIIFNEDIYFIAIGTDTKVKITMGTKEAKEAQNKINVPSLDLCSSVDWNAGTMTVKAPFVPGVRPGRLFTINPKYYQGGKALPNSVAKTDLMRDSWGLYYVITQTVSFSTTDNTNSMTVMAVPMKVSPINNQLAKYDPVYDADKLYEDFHKNYAKLQAQEIKIPKSAQSKQGKKAQEKVKDVTQLTFSLAASDRSNYTITSEDSKGIEDICMRLNLPDLKVKLNGQVQTVAGSKAWFPLVLLATYTEYKTTSNPLYEINPAAPDKIVVDKRLIIPALSWKNVQTKYKDSALQVFQTCADYYKQLPNKKSYAAQLEKAYWLLDKGSIEE